MIRNSGNSSSRDKLEPQHSSENTKKHRNKREGVAEEDQERNGMKK